MRQLRTALFIYTNTCEISSTVTRQQLGNQASTANVIDSLKGKENQPICTHNSINHTCLAVTATAKVGYCQLNGCPSSLKCEQFSRCREWAHTRLIVEYEVQWIEGPNFLRNSCPYIAQKKLYLVVFHLEEKHFVIILETLMPKSRRAVSLNALCLIVVLKNTSRAVKSPKPTSGKIIN